MINILGPRMVLMIFLGAVFVLAGTGGAFYYLDPLLSDLTSELSSTQAKVREKNAQISQIKIELDQLKDQIVVYNDLRSRSFFNKPDREIAGRSMADLVKMSGIFESTVTISPPAIIDIPEVKAIDQVMLSSPLLLKINTTNDIEVYRFLLAMEKTFPGRLQFRSLRVDRAQQVDPKLISNIRKTGPMALMQAEAEYEWVAMVPAAAATGLQGAVTK